MAPPALHAQKIVLIEGRFRAPTAGSYQCLGDLPRRFWHGLKALALCVAGLRLPAQ